MNSRQIFTRLLLAAALIALPWHDCMAEQSAFQAEELHDLRKSVQNQGLTNLPTEKQLRYLQLMYMNDGDYERSLPPHEALELATLELEARKAGNADKLTTNRQQRLLELRIIRGNIDNNPLPAVEAKELAVLQIKAKDAGGESKLSEEEHSRIVELREKLRSR